MIIYIWNIETQYNCSSSFFVSTTIHVYSFCVFDQLGLLEFHLLSKIDFRKIVV